MTTTTKTSAKPNTSAKPKAPKTTDAIELLTADHEEVSSLFAEYEKTRSAARKKALVADICSDLTVHAQIEEEIFYPAVKAALKDKLMVPEATIEHGGIKDLIAELEGVQPDGEMYDAKVQVLSEYVEHHVKEEQDDMFAKVKETSLDLVELGAQMATRKADLLAARG